MPARQGVSLARRPVIRIGAAMLALALGAFGAAASAGAATPAPASSPYTDTAGSPAAQAIAFLTAEGVFNGYSDHTFRPGNPITRAEFTTAVVRLLGPRAAQAAAALAQVQPGFKDAASIPRWAWGYVNYASGQHLINGYPDGSFQANGDITMVEAAAILVRMVGGAALINPATTWPANYTLAAIQLHLTDGVQFSANAPATRANVAQMAYDAAVVAPVYANGTQKAPLYLGGGALHQTAWNGMVTVATPNSIALIDDNLQPLVAAPLAPTYTLEGASGITDLQGQRALVAENAQGQIDYVAAEGRTGVLATQAVPTPSGYSRFTPYAVQQGTDYGLLLTDGTVVPVASFLSESAAMHYYLNAPAAGAALDPHAEIPGKDVQGGERVNYALNRYGQAIAVYAYTSGGPPGVITNGDTVTTNGASTVHLTYADGSGHSQTAMLQPWTLVTLNGAPSEASALRAGDVIELAFVGGGSTPPSGDANVRLVAATRRSVTGTIASIRSTTNGSSQTTTIGLTEAGGQTVSLVEDSNFTSTANPFGAGAPVTLLLDGQGHAREAVPVAVTPTVALLTGYGTTTEATPSGTKTVVQITADVGGQSETFTLSSSTRANPPGPSGYLATLTIVPGTTTVTNVTPVTQQYSTQTLHVLSDDGSTMVLQEAGASGAALVLQAANGAVAYHGKQFVPFGQVPIGQQVTVWGQTGKPLVAVLY